MSKFTKARKILANGFSMERVCGGWGNLAGEETPKDKLYRMASLFSLGPFDSLYYRETLEGKEMPLAEMIVEFVAKGHVSPEDAFEVAYDLSQKGIRHGVALITVGLILANRKDLVRKLPAEDLLTTPRMAFDLLAMWRIYGSKEKRYPHCLTDKIAEMLNKWNEYQLRKHYGGSHIGYTVRSLIKLSHPKPKDEAQNELFVKILTKGKQGLAVPDTWEVLISKARNRKERLKAWMYLIEKNKLPTLATLRNLRNMINDGVPLDVLKGYIYSLNPRYLNIFNVVKAMAVAPDLIPELHGLCQRFWNYQGRLKGVTEIIIDVSGSMGMLNSITELNDSNISRAISVAFSIMLSAERYRVILTAGDDFTRKHASKVVDVPLDIRELIKEIYNSNSEIGYGGIYTRQVIEWANAKFPEPDRLVVISDSQDCDFPEKIMLRPKRSQHMIEVNIAAYKNVHITEKAYGGVWTVINGFVDPVPLILLRERGVGLNPQNQEEIGKDVDLQEKEDCRGLDMGF